MGKNKIKHKKSQKKQENLCVFILIHGSWARHFSNLLTLDPSYVMSWWPVWAEFSTWPHLWCQRSRVNHYLTFSQEEHMMCDETHSEKNHSGKLPADKLQLKSDFLVKTPASKTWRFPSSQILFIKRDLTNCEGPSLGHCPRQASSLVLLKLPQWKSQMFQSECV